MKRSVLLLAFLGLLSAAAAAQQIQKPTITPKQCTDPDRAAIALGTKLHDAQKYDEAIAVYQDVLKSTPECTQAMYELSMSYYYKGDKLKAAEIASQGTKYISDDLPLFYLTLANVMDDSGKPAEAIAIYNDGIKILKDDPKMRPHLASLYYNLGVTYFAQKKYPEAREQLKNAAVANPSYASPHYLLSKFYINNSYNIPAFLASSRLISLEFNSQRTLQCVELIYGMLMPKKDAKGNVTINLNFLQPKDEGDFGMYEILPGTLTVVDGDKNKGKEPNDIFIDAIGSLADMLADDKKLQKTFVGANYIPFMVEMKKQGHLPAFGNLILFIHDRSNKRSADWLDANSPKVEAFLDWAKGYAPPVQK